MPKYGAKGDLFGSVDERLTWTKETEWNLISTCGSYRISKASLPSGPVYHLWRVGTVRHLCMGTLIECKQSALTHGEVTTAPGSKPATRSTRQTVGR